MARSPKIRSGADFLFSDSMKLTHELYYLALGHEVISLRKCRAHHVRVSSVSAVTAKLLL